MTFTAPVRAVAPPPSAGSRRRRRFALVVAALAVLLGALYIATGDYAEGSSDVYSADVSAWRLATAHTWSLDGVDLARAPYPGPTQVWTTHGADGELTVSRAPGVQVAAVPAYWLAHATGDPGGFTLAPATVTAALLTVTAVLLLGAALVCLVGRRTAILGATAFGLTTPVWTICADGMWTHTITVLGIAGMAWAASRDRWWLAGLCGGIAIWGRLHMVIVVALLGLGIALWRRRPGIALAVGVPSAVLTALASLYTHAQYGRWVPSGGYDPSGVVGYTTNAHHSPLVNELGLLVSPGRGLLIWTPVILVLLPAVVRSWRQAPDWTRVLAIAGLVYLLVQGLLDIYTGGDRFFGYRLALETLACLTPLLVLATRQLGRVGRRLLAPVLGVQLGVLGYGALANGAWGGATNYWTTNEFVRDVGAMPARLALPICGVLLCLALDRRLRRASTRNCRSRRLASAPWLPPQPRTRLRSSRSTSSAARCATSPSASSTSRPPAARRRAAR